VAEKKTATVEQEAQPQAEPQPQPANPQEGFLAVMAQKLGVPVDIQARYEAASKVYEEAVEKVRPVKEEISRLQAQIESLRNENDALFSAETHALLEVSRLRRDLDKLNNAVTMLDRLMSGDYMAQPTRATPRRTNRDRVSNREPQWTARFEGHEMICRNIGDFTARWKAKYGQIGAADVFEAWRAAGNTGPYRDGGAFELDGIQVEFVPLS